MEGWTIICPINPAESWYHSMIPCIKMVCFGWRRSLWSGLFFLVFVRLCSRVFLSNNICGCHIAIIQTNCDWILCLLWRMDRWGYESISVVCCSLRRQLEGKLVLDLWNRVGECVRNSVTCDNSLIFYWFCLLFVFKL